MTDEICSKCGSDVVYKLRRRNGLHGSMNPIHDRVPAHCSNPECDYFRGFYHLGSVTTRAEYQSRRD